MTEEIGDIIEQVFIFKFREFYPMCFFLVNIYRFITIIIIIIIIIMNIIIIIIIIIIGGGDEAVWKEREVKGYRGRIGRGTKGKGRERERGEIKGKGCRRMER